MPRRVAQLTVWAIIILGCIGFLISKFLPDQNGSFILVSKEPVYWVEDVDYGDKIVNENGDDGHDAGNLNISTLNIKYPIIIWWNPLTGDLGKVKSCDGVTKCLFTTDRHFQHHPKTKVFLFYGSDFNMVDLPLPRKSHHEWGLFHEESPRNNYILTQEEVITLFNHTATFKRSSDYPLTTQYLQKLEDLWDKKYFVPFEKKDSNRLTSPVVYIHSDCNPPSDRDSYVRELMKYIQVDSFGRCLHNKDLPARLQNQVTMDDKELYHILAQYKFTLAIENAICDDYITEKLWRPLTLGSIPIYKGSPTVRDWLPDNQSAILIDDFSNPQELAKYLHFLLQNDEEYQKYLTYRSSGIKNEKLVKVMRARDWGVNDYEKINFITGFECFVCRRIHENFQREGRNEKPHSYLASGEHLSCPRPQAFELARQSAINFYLHMFDRSKIEARDLRLRVIRN